jgi:hypothetical protein
MIAQVDYLDQARGALDNARDAKEESERPDFAGRPEREREEVNTRMQQYEATAKCVQQASPCCSAARSRDFLPIVVGA